MTSHYWGDDWFKENGEDLGKAISYCSQVWTKWGRISCSTKEKYGTFRDGAMPWMGSIQELIWPGHCFIKEGWRRFYYKVDWPLIRRANQALGLVFLFRMWQRAIYNYAVQKVCKRYPNLIDELVADLDLYEWVTPGIFGPIDGRAVHGKYWE